MTGAGRDHVHRNDRQLQGAHRISLVQDTRQHTGVPQPGYGPRQYHLNVQVDKRGRISAGILLWRRRHGELEVLLAHPGGPYWAKKDHGHWTIPKGEIDVDGDSLEAVARREFWEETGHELPDHPLTELGEITQKSGKVVHGWAIEGDLDAGAAVSNLFTMEWPPRSGRMQEFPEIDRVEWFAMPEARKRLKAAQVPFLERLEAALRAG